MFKKVYYNKKKITLIKKNYNKLIIYMIYNIVIDDDKFEDIKVVDEIDIEYIKNELKKIEIINSYTKDMLEENNISVNKMADKIEINNNNLEIAYNESKKNIYNKIYISVIGLIMSIYILIKKN